MSIETESKRIACEPFETTSAKAVVVGGLPQLKQKHELTLLKVVYHARDGHYLAGDEIYVRGEIYAHAWAKEIFELEPGVRFVLVPYEFVVCHRRKQS